MSNQPQLSGRSVYRVMLHNGIHLGHPGRGNVEKAVFARFCPYPTPPGRRLADELTVTPAGVLIVFADEGIEKLVPWANIYETDLEPAFAEKARHEAEAKAAAEAKAKGEEPAKAQPKVAPQGRIVETRVVETSEPVVANVRPPQVAPARPGRTRGA